MEDLKLTQEEIDSIHKHFPEWEMRNLKRKVKEEERFYKITIEFKELCDYISTLPDVRRVGYFEETAYDWQKMIYSYRGESVYITNKKKDGMHLTSSLAGRRSSPDISGLKPKVEDIHLKIVSQLEEDGRV